MVQPARKILMIMTSSSKSPAKTESLAIPRASPPAENVPIALLNPFTNVAPSRKQSISHKTRSDQASSRFEVNIILITQNPLTITDQNEIFNPLNRIKIQTLTDVAPTTQNRV